LFSQTFVTKKFAALAAVELAVCCLIPLAVHAVDTPVPADVSQGITALHLFEYEDANAAFRRAQQGNSRSPLGFWGEAMTYWQTLWRREDVAAGRAALARLGPTPAARAAAAGNGRDRALIQAADVLFGEGDPDARHRGYADAMAAAYRAYPDDPDVASLYALALLGTMSRGLIGYDAHEGHTQGLAGSEVQEQAAVILRRVLSAHPDHVGALHYLIHDYDDPAHARLALDAARALAKLSPPSSHARHMPSHIFVQLGMWSDAERSDRAAYDESKAWVERRRFPPTLRSFHALSWLEYDLLQRGRYAAAWDAVREMEPIITPESPTTLLSDLASMRARFVIETRRWPMLARADQFANANDLFAIGMSAARTQDVVRAERVRQALAARAQSPQEGDMRPAIAIMERELAGLIAHAEGRTPDAIQMLQAAADAELKLPPPLGLPQPIKPAPELLGEILLEAKRPREALDAFGQTLQRSANRSLSLLGAARAAAASGDADTAHRRYRELLANYDNADGDVAEVAEARQGLTRQFGPSPEAARSKPSRYVAVGLIALAAVGGGLAVALRRRRPAPVKVPVRKKKRP